MTTNKNNKIKNKEVKGMYKIIVAGSREFNDYNNLEKTLNHHICKYLLENPNTDIEIVSGTCYGADQLGERYAREHNLYIKRFPANWNKYGKAAGPIRNKQMAQYADTCIVFWNGISKGTQSMINLAKEYGLNLIIGGGETSER